MPIDYTKYPPSWRAIRARILERAQHKCEHCGVPNHAHIYREDGQWHIAPEGLDGIKFTRIVLTIAHLDHDAANWEVKDERLAALCQKCHLDYDRPHHVRKRRFGMDVHKQPKLF